MAFMHTPVTHGSGVIIVTETRERHPGREDRGHALDHEEGGNVLTRQMNTLTLWIIAAAGLTMVVMFALGLHRGQAWDVAVRQCRCTRGVRDSGGVADRRSGRALDRQCRALETQGDREGPPLGRDARVPPRSSIPTRPAP